MILTLQAGSPLSAIDNATIESIDYPILSGGASTCKFITWNNDLAKGEFVSVFESGSILRFEGYIKTKSRKKTVKEKGVKREYTAVCKSWKDFNGLDITVTDWNCTGEDFSGNGREFEEWKVREDFNKHVTWPPVGDNPVVFDDSESSNGFIASNIIEVTETEENELPSHVKVTLRQYEEIRFPVTADFPNIPTTKELRKNVAAFANHGKIFKIMDPNDKTKEFTETALSNAQIGGSKFAIIAGKRENDFRSWDLQNLSLSAQINPRTSRVTLPKADGSGSGTGTGTGTGSGCDSGSGFRNFCKVQMKFFDGDTLPRVFGSHGTGPGQQECYVRARRLIDDSGITVALGGFGGVDNIGTYDHVDVVTSFDLNSPDPQGSGEFYRDLSFGGAKALLDDENDLGEGKWKLDLSGVYTAKEGISRANEAINKAIAHYDSTTLTKSATIAGINWNQDGKIEIDGTEVVLDSIGWMFGLEASKNRTNYKGTLRIKGFSPAVQKKKRHIEKQEKFNQRSKKNDPSLLNVIEQQEDQQDGIKEHAKIAWNIDETEGDLSKGQLMVKQGDNFVNKEIAGQPIVVWMSFEESLALAFKTAGNSTIFEVELIEVDVTRNTGAPETLDLYRAIGVVDDRGDRITQFFKKAKTKDLTANDPIFTRFSDNLLGILASKDLGNPNDETWDEFNEQGEGISNSKIIFTAIGSPPVSFPNKLIVKYPNEWDLAATEDFLFSERSGESAAMPHLYRPIDEKLDNKTNKTWQSDKKYASNGSLGNQDDPIANYRKK